MAKVYIGVGHGGSDPGAVKYLVEKDIDLQMAKGCRDYLKEHGVDAVSYTHLTLPTKLEV